MKNKISLAGYIILLVAICSSCLTFCKSDQALYREMKKKDMAYEIHYDSSCKLRWLWYKNENAMAPLLLFIHGAPGSSSTFIKYINDKRLRDSFSMLVVDRPGYGFSDYGNYQPIPMQYQAIQHILGLAEISGSVVTIGHSFGGTISGYIAIQNPEWLKATIMIAPAIDPNQEKYLWFGKLAKYKSTRWLSPRSLRVAADEKYSHEDELNTFLGDWNRIKKPVLHIHGDADGLVPYGNVTFSKNNIPNKWLKTKTFKNVGHLIHLKERESMIDEIIHFISNLESTNKK